MLVIFDQSTVFYICLHFDNNYLIDFDQTSVKSRSVDSL